MIIMMLLICEYADDGNVTMKLLLQNQFFVTIHDDSVVENKIASALYDRIMQAHRYEHLTAQSVISSMS